MLMSSALVFAQLASAKCAAPPTALTLIFTLPGFFRINARNSANVFSGRSERTTIQWGRVLTKVTGTSAASGSMGRLAFVCFITVIVPDPVKTMLAPSAGLLITDCTPIIEPAPVIFSTMTGCFTNDSIFLATSLAMASVDPPALNGTTIRTALAGQTSAIADVPNSTMTSARMA